MEDVHGKEISLQYVTVKIPGHKPRGSKTVNSSSISEPFVNLSISSKIIFFYRCYFRWCDEIRFNQIYLNSVKSQHFFMNKEKFISTIWIKKFITSKFVNLFNFFFLKSIEMIVYVFYRYHSQNSNFIFWTSVLWLSFIFIFGIITVNFHFFNFLGSQYKEKRCSDKVLLTAFEVFKEPNSKSASNK